MDGNGSVLAERKWQAAEAAMELATVVARYVEQAVVEAGNTGTLSEHTRDVLRQESERVRRRVEFARGTPTDTDTQNEWAARCAEWAEQLDADRGFVPTGLATAVGELADKYGPFAVLEATTAACRKRRGVACELATWSGQLVAISRLVQAEAKGHIPAEMSGRLDERANRVEELCQFVWEAPE